MNPLGQRFDDADDAIRWTSLGSGPPIVLVHGTPYSSRILNGIVPGQIEHREVFLFNHLGYGVRAPRKPGSEQSRLRGADLRACSSTGANLLLFDAVTGGD